LRFISQSVRTAAYPGKADALIIKIQASVNDTQAEAEQRLTPDADQYNDTFSFCLALASCHCVDIATASWSAFSPALDLKMITRSEFLASLNLHSLRKKRQMLMMRGHTALLLLFHLLLSFSTTTVSTLSTPKMSSQVTLYSHR
jgi:hypothetical protein